MAIRKQEKTAQETGQTAQSNNTAQAQAEGAGRPLPELTVRIFPVRNTNSKLKATANIRIADAFAVQGFRIFDSKNGLFVKEPEQSYVKEGTELTRPVFFPVTKEEREALHGQILHSYELTMEKEMGQRQEDNDYFLGGEDAPPLMGDEDVPTAQRDYLPDDDLPFDMGQSM
ncbi:septation protein SpoVG family protein [Acutalibacter muris]|uniref:septation protein SpoVG family protein n=1 Tax=Acutalibacter muris TaxID=1796620 RepID=UPI00272E846E|nr:septation protein SpoVG family protein [Acutalibacter muris]